jgi:hypothetical protein
MALPGFNPLPDLLLVRNLVLVREGASQSTLSQGCYRTYAGNGEFNDRSNDLLCCVVPSVSKLNRERMEVTDRE